MTSSSPSSSERRFSLHPVCPHNPFNFGFFIYLFLWLLLLFFSFYVQFTAGRQHGDENSSSVYEPRDGRRWLRNLTSSSIRSCQLSLNLLNVRADVIGEQIVLVLVDLRIHIPESDSIYLVDWKRGRMTLVSRACLMYAVRHGR
jgi:hypothetical protein